MSTVADDQSATEITKTLTDYLVSLVYEDIPTRVLESAKLYTLECLGHMVSAQTQPVAKLVVEYLRQLGASPQALAVGTGLRTAVAEAAYANGTFAHTDELESYGTLPGTGLIPPIAAGITVGDWMEGTTGRVYLAAVVAGIEMQGRLGTAGIGACDRGFMGISLVGTGGAAITASKLVGLDSSETRNALGIALPLSNGSLRGCGYMTHAHEAGIPARTGVFAAQMARNGFTGCTDYLDGSYSWGAQFAGDSSRPYAPDALTNGLGESFFLDTCDVAPKVYGSCGLTHQTIQGTIDLMTQYTLSPIDIEEVELLVPPWADRVAAFKEPADAEQAKFSIRHGVAGVLVDGVPELPYRRPFSHETFNDPRYIAARKRVNLKIEPDVPSQRDFAQQEVTLHLKDGRTLTSKVSGASVRGKASAELSVGERVDMFRRTVSTLGTVGAEALVELVMNLEDHTIAEVVEALGVKKASESDR